MRKYPVRFGGGPGEKAETSDLACGLPYPASGGGSAPAFSGYDVRSPSFLTSVTLGGYGAESGRFHLRS